VHAAPGLQGCNHRVQAPRLDLLVACLCETLEACGVVVHRTDICLQADVLSRGGAAHLSEPAQVGRGPIGPAGVSDILSEQEGLETELGVFAIADGVCTRPSEIPDGFICNGGGTETAVRSPERASLARCTAARRSVLTRSPGFLGMSAGATPQQSWPCFMQSR
jgi:hypothetical protein